jgi:Ca2+-binding RTX toxin-like protein
LPAVAIALKKATMKFIAVSRVIRPGRKLAVAGLLIASVLSGESDAEATDPNLQVAITRTNQSVVMSWFGSNTMAYQVEASSNLTVWGSASPIFSGSGGVLFFTNPIAGLDRGFFRVRRISDTTSAVFNPQTGVLTITGDALPNIIVVSRDLAGNLRVNNGTIAITGGTPTVANTSLIQIFGGAENDQLSLDESNGALPVAHIFGEAGDDTLTGGSGADILNGGPGDDTLFGMGGADSLLGGEDDDTIIGGDGDDIAQLGPGNDRFIWNPGDDTDLIEGGDGIDTVEINGGNGVEQFTTTANGTRVRFDRLNPAPFALDIGTCENLILNANGGDDSFSATGNLAALITITVDGGPGNDTILGSNGIDLLLGGDGNDFIDGQQGNDVILLGAGDDVVQWDPGDGSDTIEGQAGNDRLIFNGSAGSEIFEVSPNGSRARFTRNLGNIVMDLGGVESLELKMLAGTDSFTVNDLAGTDLTSVSIDLAGTLGGSIGDAATDTIIVNGSNGADIIDVSGAGTAWSVVGLTTLINVTNSEGANDALVINALGGNDGVVATTLPAGVVRLTIDGGEDDDTILGSQGDDVLLGGAGNDYIFGDNGNDLALMGAGADVFEWFPGDGNDTVEGQDGDDTLIFFGSNAAENIDVLSNGGRVIFFRNVGNVTMDLNDVETIDFRALGGADNIVAGDLSGTDLTKLNLDLRGPNGGGDGAADTITINGTQSDDNFGVAGDAGGINVFGLHTAVNIFFAEPTDDRLTLNALGGHDTVDATALEAGGIQLTMNGGLGNDVLLGSAAADLITGGDGNDLVLMGGGDDTFVWNPGDDNDTVEGQGGLDHLLFNGANVAENITIFPNGERVLFFRDVASVTMDLNDTELITFNALGGADTIVVHDLSGTDATTVELNLAALGGSGDAAADHVIVHGTSTDDVILVDGDATGTSVSGLAARVNISGAEAANDRLTINALAGDDVVDASGLAAGAIQLTADGGAGEDILLGGAGADVLLGGDHDDVLLGGPGVDVLDGGAGDDIEIPGGGDATTGIVTILGDDADNTITISRTAGGNILSNGVAIAGATVANTTMIRVFGRGGNDVIALDEALGALPRAMLFGGTGTNMMAGGSGADLLFGGNNTDLLLGSGGDDFLFGRSGDDMLAGGDGDDLIFGEAGNDRMAWSPGDDTDLNEGGSGSDTVEVNGGNGAEVFTVTANGARVRFDRIDPAPFALDIGTTEHLVLNANGGHDSFSATGNLAALIKITVDGGPGNDTILGSNGIDLLLGGDGNDFIDGQQGNDVIFLGAGDDVVQWDPGDGSDTIEGQDGNDKLLFNGSNVAEIFDVAANGSRVRFTRNVGTIVMDLNGIETLDVNALGGADTFVINDLTGTDLFDVIADLAASGGAGDAQVDNVIVNGTGADDTVLVTGASGAVSVLGLFATVTVTGSEAVNDRLTINTLAGDDVMDASGLPAGIISLTADGGADHDVLIGSDGPDVLLGGPGDDVLMGGPGIDILDGGPGDNIVIQ